MRATAGVDELIEIALYWVHPVCTSKASTVPGLKWKKLDLHVHTPASDCFCKAESNIAPEDVVAAACAQGLGGIAVTDHMTGAWVDRVCEAASDTGLIVFPGVELSVHNYHVIALFPHDYGGKDIEGLLGACGVLPGDYGRTDKPITRDPLEVLEEIHLRGGLAVLAHIDCEHTGAWHTAGKASVRKALFNSHAYDAVEVQGESLPDELCIESVAKNRGFARFPAWYRASDNPHPEDITKHSLLGIGIAYTHFKGEESFTLESLRQCFQDPEQRIRQQDQPTTVPHPCIKRVEIRGGYLDGVSCVFHDELTSIVGGKGVGKSLLVECIRLALGDVSGVDSIAEDHRSKIAGQLGVGSQVTLQCVSSAGTEYNIEVEIDATTGESEDSDYDATARITSIETNEPVDVQASDILPLTAFSQGEIVEISREKSEQLLQLDSFVDLQEVNEKIEVLTTDLQTCVDGLVASLGARDAAANLASRSSKLKEDLKAVEDSLDADIFSEYKEYEAANELIKKALDSWQGVISPVAEAGEAVDLWTPLEQSSELCQPHLAGIRTRQEQAREGVREILARLTKSIEEQKKDCVDSLKPWREEFADVKAKYDNYISETGTRKSLSSKRDGMKRRLSEVERELQEATEISGEWKSEWGKAIDIADKLDGALSDRYNARFAKAEDLTKLSEGVLRLSVEEAADSSPATQLLRSVQSGLHSKTLESLAQNVPAHRLALLLLNPNYELTSGIQDDQLEKLRHRVMSLDDRVSVLKALMSAVPEDTPLIEYRKTRSEYAPIEKVSQGQRCTALITLALLEGSAPVIIDQPEDSLDIRAVWDDIAISVRRKKHQRQFIFTTHNSTIAVAADSDCIAVLEPDGARARMTHEGSIDLHRIKESAIQHLEGGPQAYLLRRKKYNISNE